jgi:PAS domain S-box-containing protein
MMFPFKLHAKFLILVLGILIVFFGILSYVIIEREVRILSSKAAEKEHLLARIVVAGLKESMLTGRPRSTLRVMESLQGAYGLVRLAVLRKNGTHAFDVPGPRFSMEQIAQVFESGKELDFNEAGVIPLHTNIFPLLNERACIGCHEGKGGTLGVILVSHSLEDTIKEIGTSKRQLMILLAVLIVVMGTALYVAVRKVILAPLQTLHHGARIIGMGDFGHHIGMESGDEFSELAHSFNDMALRVKETYSGLENRVRVRTKELNENVRLLRGILSSMSSGVVLLSREGRIKLLNRQGARIFGHGHEDLVGRKLAEVIPEAVAFARVRVGSYDEITVRTPDGDTVPIGFTSSYYSGGEGEQYGQIVVFQDLTELKTLQKELINKERFAAMGRVVAGVAHEIRNPLFGISAIGQIFERDLTDPAHQELTRALLAETKRLNQLVDELLIYGKPMKLNREETDLRILWEEVLDPHREELQRKGITVSGDYAVRHPVAYFDPYQMRQVFLNLLRNAIEATPNGGSIDISMLIADKVLLFRVADTGSGIPSNDLDHVFDLFYTTKPKGTGLGLAICRKIMQDHGGDITIISTERRGTTVTIKLPYGKREDRPIPGLPV